MKNNKDSIDFRDKILIELKYITSAFRMIQSLDTERIPDIDLEMFANLMEKHSEYLYDELEKYFYPPIKKITKTTK